MARKDQGGALSNHHAWGHLDGDTHPNWRTDIDDNPGGVWRDGPRDGPLILCFLGCSGVFILNVKSYFNATWFLVLAMLYDACQHSTSRKKVDSDRTHALKIPGFCVTRKLELRFFPPKTSRSRMIALV